MSGDNKKVWFPTTNFFDDNGEDDEVIPFMVYHPLPIVLEKLKNGDEIVIAENNIAVCFDYPFKDSFYFNFTADTPMGFTRKHLAKCIIQQYMDMYAEEEQTLNEKEVIPIEERGSLLNRNETDGKYGIWGHDLGDLSLNYIYNVEGVYHLSIDS